MPRIAPNHPTCSSEPPALLAHVAFTFVLHQVEHLRARFNELDTDQSGVVDADEYSKYHLTISLLEDLVRQPRPLVAIFERWDGDASGAICAFEFAQAVKELKLPAARGCSDEQLEQVFSAVDKDGSGTITFIELKTEIDALLSDATSKKYTAIKTRIRRGATKYPGSALSAGEVMQAGKNAIVQLCELLEKNMQLKINLFREWDVDGDGVVSRKEFHRAMAVLSFDVPRTVVDLVFDEIDANHNGVIEYKELHRAVKGVRAAPLRPGPKEHLAKHRPQSVLGAAPLSGALSTILRNEVACCEAEIDHIKKLLVSSTTRREQADAQVHRSREAQQAALELCEIAQHDAEMAGEKVSLARQDADQARQEAETAKRETQSALLELAVVREEAKKAQRLAEALTNNEAFGELDRCRQAEKDAMHQMEVVQTQADLARGEAVHPNQASKLVSHSHSDPHALLSLVYRPDSEVIIGLLFVHSTTPRIARGLARAHQETIVT
jgi:Ca2+-binding EF-hand superfamily protein